MNIYMQMGLQKQEEERREKWLRNSERLSATYGMTKDVFEALVMFGYNPKKYLGTKEFRTKGVVIV